MALRLVKRELDGTGCAHTTTPRPSKDPYIATSPLRLAATLEVTHSIGSGIQLPLYDS